MADAIVEPVRGPARTDVTEPPGRAVPPDPAPTSPDDGDVPVRRRPISRRATVAVLSALVAAPLLVALVVLADGDWRPPSDLAMTEMRLRDFGTGHVPLGGLPGRIEGFGASGSHPGPVSFWVLAVPYHLLGREPWAMLLGSVAVHTAAVVAVIALAERRGGRRAALGMAAALAVLLHALGPERLTQPWNPYMPVLWWVAFLLAAWSVLDDDLPVLPLAVVAGSFCAQTHLPYLGLVGVIGGLVALALVVRAWRAEPAARRRLARAGWPSAVLAPLLWSPPLLQQLTSSPGNGSLLLETFRHNRNERVGVAAAVEAWLAHLDVGALVTGDQRVVGSPWPGLALLAAWVAAVAVAARVRHARLLWLHAVVAVALVIGLVSTASVSGMLFSYLVLWSWGTTTLCLTATGATAVMAAEAWSRRRQDIGQPRPRWAVRVAPLLAAVLIVASGALALDATQAAPPAEGEAEAFDALIPPLVGGISDGSLPGGGRRGRYVVETSDAYNPGLSGYTVMLELERHGINAGVPTYFRTGAGAHRVLTRDEATAVITFVSGADHVAEWRSRPEATLVAEFTPPADTRRKETELRRQIVALVERVGHPELVDHMDGSALGTTAHPDMPLEALPPLSEMIALPHPSAIFVSPPTT